MSPTFELLGSVLMHACVVGVRSNGARAPTTRTKVTMGRRGTCEDPDGLTAQACCMLFKQGRPV